MPIGVLSSYERWLCLKKGLSLIYNIMKYRTYLLHYIMGYPAVSIMSMMV